MKANSHLTIAVPFAFSCGLHVARPVWKTWQLSVLAKFLRIISLVLILLGSHSITWAGTAQTISFPEIPMKTTTDVPFALGATASSGLTVSYTIVAGGAVASVAGSTVTLTGAEGPVTLKASQAGNGTYDAADYVYATFQVMAPSQKFVKLARGLGASHSVGIRADGTLWAWGENFNGQLGLGDGVNRSIPVQVGLASNWATVACGVGHTLAVKSDGTLWAWGRNEYGQLGAGTLTNSSDPLQIGTTSNWVTISCGGSHTLAVKSDGTLWAWGRNSYGQLGDGSTVHRNSPVRVGTASNWVTVACGGEHTLAVKSDGTLWAWGYGGEGQLGISGGYSPLQVGTASNWVTVACGGEHTLAVKSDGTLWAWGYNLYGQLGDGTTGRKLSPVRVGLASNWVTVTCGNSHTLAVKSDGTLWAWGRNEYGQLGAGTLTNSSDPLQIGTTSNWVTISCGGSHTLAVKSDGTLWAWGLNASVQLGGGTQVSRFRPVPTNNWATVACGDVHTLAVKSNGTLWTWGRNDYGQLGLGDTLNRSIPVQIGTASNWATVACGDVHTLAVKSNGTLWTWGRNDYGQLGLGDTLNRSIPVQIGTTSNWVTVACGTSHTLAVKSDGTLWAWGRNDYGQLGDGSTAQRNSPVRVGTASNWVSVACGGEHTLAVKSDGTLWTWGLNEYGQLGLGDTLNRSIPVQIGTASNWVTVTCGNSHTLAVKSDGTLWAWGGNFYGELGDGSTAQRNNPVQIGTASNWAAVAGGALHTLAVKSDGTLWAWGYNLYGQLGDGTQIDHSSPVQVGSSTAWWKLPNRLAGRFIGWFSAALVIDGTLWTCGDDALGQLGTIDRSLPGRTWPVQNLQTLSFPALPTLSIGQPVTLHATSSSQLPVTYRVLGPATLNGNILTPSGAGTIQVIARQSGDVTWFSTEALLPAQAAPPTVTTLAASSITSTSAVLNGTVDAQDSNTEVSFEYGLNNDYGMTVTGTPTPVTGSSITAVSATLTGLSLGITYHFRVKGVSGNGTSHGSDIIFTTIGVPEIALEQSAVGIANGGSKGFGSAPIGSTVDLTFTVKNTGTADLTLSGTPKVAVSGTDATLFAVTAQPTSPVTGPSGTTNFTVRFAPTSSGLKTAALAIPNNDADEGPYDINLTGTGLAFTDDTDGDGLNDASEFQMATLGFNWQVNQAALVSTLFSNLNGALPKLNASGFYSTAQVQALNLGVPLIQRNPTTGQFTLTIGVEKSTDLSTFNPFPLTAPETIINGTGKLEFRFTVPDNAAFFRLQSQ